VEIPLDIVRYEFNVKLNIGNYSSAGVSVSLQSAVKDDETAEQAFDRVRKIVEKQVELKIAKIMEKKNG
jgi:hypothetical protein